MLRITRYKYFVKTPGMILLALFLVSYIISIFVNIKYGINADVANLVILGLTFAIVYLQDSSRDKIDVKKEMAIISKALYYHLRY